MAIFEIGIFSILGVSARSKRSLIALFDILLNLLRYFILRLHFFRLSRSFRY